MDVKGILRVSRSVWSVRGDICRNAHSPSPVIYRSTHITGRQFCSADINTRCVWAMQSIAQYSILSVVTCSSNGRCTHLFCCRSLSPVRQGFDTALHSANGYYRQKFHASAPWQRLATVSSAQRGLSSVTGQS